MSKYKPVHRVSTVKLGVRGLQYAVHTWGKVTDRPVLLLHGFADTGMSFQFLADVLAADCYLIAPDWRGFGDTAWSAQGYWFPDYLADLDVLVDRFSPSDAVILVGHSMGGNIACMYAGIRQHRVSHLASLDAFGLPDSDPADAPLRYGIWLDQLKDAPGFSNYTDLDQLVIRIQKLAPGLDTEQAFFVAENWSTALGNGAGFGINFDPAHKRVNPVLYRREEVRSCWRNITARTLLLYGEDSLHYQKYYKDGCQQENQRCFSNLSEDFIAGAGHMLHLTHPGILAEKLRMFFTS